MDIEQHKGVIEIPDPFYFEHRGLTSKTIIPKYTHYSKCVRGGWAGLIWELWVPFPRGSLPAGAGVGVPGATGAAAPEGDVATATRASISGD
jgi:hypothetical protein